MITKSLAKNMLLILVCLAAFAGCSMPLSGFDVKGDNFSGVVSNLGKLRLSASPSESAGARTIMPPHDSADYDYYLCGSEAGGSVFGNMWVSVDSASGFFSAPVGNGFWNLVLFAVPRGTDALSYSPSDIAEKASLVARTSIQVTGPEKRVPFRLSPDSLKTVGFVYFNIELSNDGGSSTWTLDGSQYECRAELANLLTGETVIYADKTPTSQTISFNASGIGTFGRDPNPPALAREDCAIAPGTYTFRVIFTDKSTHETLATWSDIILVIPNRTTSGNSENCVYIPNIIGQPPTEPASFTATYVEGSEDLSYFEGDGREVNREGFYQVHFQWEDNSNNETGFEIQVADVSGNATGTVDWDSADTPITTYINSLSAQRPGHIPGIYLGEGSSARVDGSLENNSTFVTMYLELGRQYAARIRSCNYAGASDWVAVTLPTLSPAGYDEYNSGNGSVKIMPFVADGSSSSPLFINRFRITYCLNSGVYEIAPHATVSKDKVVYASQCNPIASAVGIGYWDGAGYDDSKQTDDLRLSTVEYDTNGNRIEWVDKAFKYWCTNYDLSAGSRVYEKGASSNGNYKEYANLTLYAAYEGSVTVDRTGSDYRADYDLQGDWFSVSTTPNAVPPITPSPSSPSYSTYYKYSKSALGSNKIVVELKIPNDVDDITPGDQKFSVNYNKIDCVVTDLAGNKKYSLSVPDAEPYTEFGYDIAFPVAECDVSDWNAGIYLFTFTATASPSDTKITREMTLIVELA